MPQPPKRKRCKRGAWWPAAGHALPAATAIALMVRAAKSHGIDVILCMFFGARGVQLRLERRWVSARET